MDDITTQGEELLAAELEGIAPMPADLVPLREEKLILDKQIEELQARKKDIQEIFGKSLKDAGLVGYLLNGKVHARRSSHTRTNVDSKKLKEELPHIYKNYLKVIAYTSVTVN